MHARTAAARRLLQHGVRHHRRPAAVLGRHTEGNILIQGETGTGKELFARAIHADGPRAGGPFVAGNCAAIPLELAESELFGYERGAFTGAKAEGHPGKFEMAHQGTIFLDEINSMPLQVQAKILRVVETKRVSRINGKREIPVNVRVITASNGNRSEEVSRGALRKDLFFRLNVLPLRVPPLRDMKEDLRYLLEAFLRELAERHGAPEKRVSDGAFRWLAAYDWPGNTLGVAALLAAFWRDYGELARPLWPDLRETALAVAAGVAVFFLWTSLDQPWMRLGEATAGFRPVRCTG